MKKAKILHIISSLGSGGAEKILADIVCNESKFDHIVISLKNKGFYYKHLSENSIVVHQLGINKLNFLIKLFLG